MKVESGQIYRHLFEELEIKITKEGQSFSGIRTWNFEVVKGSGTWVVGSVENLLESTLNEFFFLIGDK